MLVASITSLIPMDYREAFASTSFPGSGPTDEFLAEQGFARVNTFKPHDTRRQKLIPTAPHYEAPWVYTVDVVDKSADELEQDRQEKAAAIRRERNQMLNQTDWTQVADAPVDKQAWASYRQALRDVTSQETFPESVVWPVAPDAA